MLGSRRTGAPQVRFEVRGESEQAPQVAFNGPRTSIMLKVPGPCRTLAAPLASRLTTPCPVRSTPHQRGPITSRMSCRVWSDELCNDELRGGGRWPRGPPLVPVGLDQLAADGQQQPWTVAVHLQPSLGRATHTRGRSPCTCSPRRPKRFPPSCALLRLSCMPSIPRRAEPRWVGWVGGWVGD